MKIEGNNFEIGTKYYYIEAAELDRLQNRIEKLEKVLKAARDILCGHAKVDCEYFSIPSHDMNSLKKSIEELGGEK